MSPVSTDRIAETQPPLNYLQRIDLTLENRSEIVKQLISIRSAPESSGFRSEIDTFISALKSEVLAKDFVKEGAFAAWLAAIYDWSTCPRERSKQISALASAIARNADIRWTRSLTLTYLGTLLFALFATFLFLCGTVIPIFAEMFDEFGLKRPLPTEFVLWLGASIGPYARAVFFIIVTSILMVWLGRRILRSLLQGQYLPSNLWMLSWGSTARVVAMSRCLIALSSLLKLGAPLREALIISGRASQSSLLVQQAVRLSNELKAFPIAECSAARAFPPIVVDCLREDGLTRGDPESTAYLLRELGILYSERARHRHEWILRFLLPIFLVLVGGMFAVMVLALFLPLTSLVTSLI